MTTAIKTPKAIAETINAGTDSYYGESAKAWDGNGISRIYFGRDYVTIEADGRVHADSKKARAQTAGQSAIDLVEAAMN